MTDINGTEIIDEAAEIVETESDPPMSLAEFVEEVVDHSEYACSAPEYLLRAIEHFGTRSVTEHGEELDRYRFFDDPANDGEHAILGNTELLNRFVEDIRQLARGTANETKMFWFEGPTATGKSELKRCLINGLNAFSKTDDGKRFTIEWSVTGSDVDPTYYGDGSGVSRTWYESPVQVNPLSVLPEEIRREVLHGDDADPSAWVPPGLDPFSDEAYQLLEEKYDGSFEDIVDEAHCRVNRYTIDVGRGIGTLQSEDGGRPRQKLVGEWMGGMIEQLDSRGRRNPQALSYDGVLSQGNTGLTIIEDAAHHFDTIRQMLSVPEDDEIKIDRRTVLPIDTVAVIISNPDMRSELMKTSDSKDDSYRPLRRRLDLYEIPYLVTPSIEAELLHRLLTGHDTVWDEDAKDRVTDRIEIGNVEIAPHGLEAAAMYDVVTRITTPTDISSIEKARLYDGEEIMVGGEELELDDVKDDVADTADGRQGIPCTFTRDVLADVVGEHREDDNENVIMPRKIIRTMEESMHDSPVFGTDEAHRFIDDGPDVEEYVLDEQAVDVLDAMLRDHTVDNDEVRKYIEHVYCWGTDEDAVDPDDTFMRVFEVEHLGRFDDSHYGLDTESGLSTQVTDFRENEIISGVSAYLYSNRDDGYEVDLDDVPPSELPALQDLVDEHDWEDVVRTFDDLDPEQWQKPLEGTQTEAIKEETIDNMVDMFDYTEESARKTADRVFQYVVASDVFPRVQNRDEPVKEMSADDEGVSV